MLIDRYNFSGRGSVIKEDNLLLGEHINSRKAYFTKLNRVSAAGKKRNLRNGPYRRGNMFSNRGFSQRVVVKAHYKRHNTGISGAGNLRGHLGYITRDGAGVDGERPVLFGAEGDNLSRADFYNLCKGDRHHFRLIISPENAHEIDDFQGYIHSVMERVEEDLDTRLEWVSSIHYDTDHPHAHVVLRGKDDKGKDLVIAPDYISFGIRGVAQEVVTEILGERTLAEINEEMEKEAGAMRVTSLDRFIEKRGVVVEDEDDDVNEIRINSRDIGRKRKDAFYQGLVKRRLAFLATTSMARAEAHGVYYVRADFISELKEISEKHDIIKQLHRVMPEEERGISIYKIEDGKGPTICGLVEKIANINELTDNKYMVMRAGDELHYVPIALNDCNELLREGMIVEVSAGGKSTPCADANILEIASMNDGIYTRAAHLEYVKENMKFIEDGEIYVDYHGTRLETLEKSGFVEEQESGGYWVPDDIVDLGAKLNASQELKQKKHHYTKIKQISSKPIEEQVTANARTWLR